IRCAAPVCLAIETNQSARDCDAGTGPLARYAGVRGRTRNVDGNGGSVKTIDDWSPSKAAGKSAVVSELRFVNDLGGEDRLQRHNPILGEGPDLQLPSAHALRLNVETLVPEKTGI